MNTETTTKINYPNLLKITTHMLPLTVIAAQRPWKPQDLGSLPGQPLLRTYLQCSCPSSTAKGTAAGFSGGRQSGLPTSSTMPCELKEARLVTQHPDWSIPLQRPQRNRFPLARNTSCKSIDRTLLLIIPQHLHHQGGRSPDN